MEIRLVGGGCCMRWDRQRHGSKLSLSSILWKRLKRYYSSQTFISLFASHLPTFLCATSEWTQLIVNNYNRAPIIRINWDCEPSGYAENPENLIFFKTDYNGSLNFGCYYLQYVPASEPFDHAWLEVLESITLYRTWSDNRWFQGEFVW